MLVSFKVFLRPLLKFHKKPLKKKMYFTQIYAKMKTQVELNDIYTSSLFSFFFGDSLESIFVSNGMFNTKSKVVFV